MMAAPAAAVGGMHVQRRQRVDRGRLGLHWPAAAGGALPRPVCEKQRSIVKDDVCSTDVLLCLSLASIASTCGRIASTCGRCVMGCAYERRRPGGLQPGYEDASFRRLPLAHGGTIYSGQATDVPKPPKVPFKAAVASHEGLAVLESERAVLEQLRQLCGDGSDRSGLG